MGQAKEEVIKFASSWYSQFHYCSVYIVHGTFLLIFWRFTIYSLQ